VTEGEKTSFECLSESNTKWNFNGKLPIPTNAVISMTKKKLIISSVSLDNAGFYTCKGKDSRGTPFSSRGYLKVKSKLNIRM